MWAVSTSANHIYVKGWHLQDTWCMMLTLYDYQRTFTSGFAGESWFSTANKAAKRPTSVGSTPVDVLGIFLDIFVVTKLCYLFFHETCRYFKCFFCDVKSVPVKGPADISICFLFLWWQKHGNFSQKCDNFDLWSWGSKQVFWSKATMFRPSQSNFCA